MPRLTKKVPGYQHHRASGQARVRLDGKDHYLGAYGTAGSRREYDRVIAEWLASGRNQPAARPNLTISELISRYKPFAEGYYVKNGKPTSELHNVKIAVSAVRRLYGATLVRDFGPLAIKAVREGWVADGITRGEINKRVGRIARMIRWGVENELVDAAVHQALKAVPGLKKGRSAAREGKPVRPVPDAEVDAIKGHVARQVWAMIELQRLTGMRSGEVTTLRTGDVDRSGDVWVYVPESHKTEHHGKERRVFLGPKAQEILTPWLRADPDAYLFSPAEAMEEHRAERRAARRTPMTPSQRARRPKKRPKKAPRVRYGVDSYGRTITAGIIKANDDRAARGEPVIPHWHPHQLRHSAATAMRREFGVDVARILLGHSAVVVTEIYAELDSIKAIEATRKIG